VSKWIAIAGRKGGVGKSSCALGLAAHWLGAGKSVVLVDLDPQGSASLAVSAEATGESLRAALAGEMAAQAQQIDGIANLYVLAGGPALTECQTPIPLRTMLLEWTPDYVLVDCPPGHPHLDRLAIEAADVLLACCESHRMAVAGASRVIGEARAIDPSPRCALVLGRFDVRRGLDLAAPELLAGALNVPVMTIRQDSVLSQALNAGELPPMHGRAAEDIAKIAAWID
jgi:chromosome partitioning protein